MTILRAVVLISVLLCFSAATQSNPGDKNGPDLSRGWPTTYTLRVLQDAGLVDAGQVDSTWATRLASEKTHKLVWMQLYYITFKLRTGRTVEAIANVQESTVPDMRSGPVVYVVSKVLQPEGKAEPAQKE